MVKNLFSVRIKPNTIPQMQTKLLCSVFLDAVLRFYKDPENEEKFKMWCAEKGEDVYEQKNS